MKEALKLAQKALSNKNASDEAIYKALHAIKAALAQDQGADYERGFIDGMQKQMQSSVDKAVNVMSRTWVGLTEEEVEQLADGCCPRIYWQAIELYLKEKNT